MSIVEVRLKPYSNYPRGTIRTLLTSWIKDNLHELTLGSNLRDWDDISPLKANIESIWIDDPG